MTNIPKYSFYFATSLYGPVYTYGTDIRVFIFACIMYLHADYNYWTASVIGLLLIKPSSKLVK